MNKEQFEKIMLICASFSALLTFVIFITSRNNQFVALDDYAYIVTNQNISTFDWQTVIWSFTTYYEGNWHPLTMLSLALDQYFWGLNPFGYHLTNVVLHSSSVFCSCFLFSRLLASFNIYADTPAVSSCHLTVPDLDNQQSHSVYNLNQTVNTHPLSFRAISIGSFSAALFFGLHPLRVESVVWASERKDVLCILFMIMSIFTYVRYAEKRGVDGLSSCWRNAHFSFAVLLAVLAQMSKPTAVSLPLILFIIDWCPLQRTFDRRTVYLSLIEKIPFFIISAIGTVLTIFAQQIAMKYAPNVELISRLLVACKALLFYIVKTVWPDGLTAFYIHPGNIASYALAEYLFYVVLVLIITIAVVCVGYRHRIWPALWLYYVITLVPMLGLVQVGGQWVADRYSYLPSLGIALLWGGGVAYLSDGMQRSGRLIVFRFCVILAACQLSFYTVLTIRQVSVWRNTDTLATRIIEISPHQSGAPYLARALYRNENGQYQSALGDVGEAMKIALQRGLTRSYPDTAFVQAVVLRNLGRYSEALTILEWGIEMCVDTPPPDALSLKNELTRLAARKK